jgi:hypothetical protein
VQRHRLRQRHRRRRGPHGVGALEERTLDVELRLDGLAVLGVGGGGEPLLESLDRGGDAAHVELARGRVLRLAGENLLARELVADDLDFGPVDLVAVRVIEVIVRVHDPADRLGRDRLQLFAQRPRAAGRDVRVDHEHVAIAFDDRGVRHHHQAAGGDRMVDAFLDLVEGERRAFVIGARRACGRGRALLRRDGRAGTQGDGGRAKRKNDEQKNGAVACHGPGF